MFSTRRQVSDERYEIIMNRYEQFQDSMSNANLEPVKVFDPLNQKQIDELHLIREVSLDLQKKKQEDINKAAQQQAEAEKKAKEESAVEAEAEAKETVEKTDA